MTWCGYKWNGAKLIWINIGQHEERWLSIAEYWHASILLCKAKMSLLLTLKVSYYCIPDLYRSIVWVAVACVGLIFLEDGMRVYTHGHQKGNKGEEHVDWIPCGNLSNNQTFISRWFNDGQPSQIVTQHWTSIKSLFVDTKDTQYGFIVDRHELFQKNKMSFTIL